MKLEIEVAIVGAGMAGLVCARELQQAGFRPVILEKSRGVGGRVATRRLQDTCADHGLVALSVQGDRTRDLMARFTALLRPWHGGVFGGRGLAENGYISPQGMNQIPKQLARNLDIYRQHRVETLVLDSDAWQLQGDGFSVRAKAVVLAIPAPQAIALTANLELPNSFHRALQGVDYHSCLTVMASYCSLPLPDWEARKGEGILAWIGLDSSKRENASVPIFVYHSAPEFAARYLDASNLDPAAQQMLAAAGEVFPGLEAPTGWQIHRWRYGLPKRSFPQPCLSCETPNLLVACGDWCGGDRLEAALTSGMAAAQTIREKMDKTGDFNPAAKR